MVFEIIILLINDLLLFLVIGGIIFFISFFILLFLFLFGIFFIGSPLYDYRKIKSDLIQKIEEIIITMDDENLEKSKISTVDLYKRVVLNDLLEKNRKLPPLPIIYLPALVIIFPSLFQFLLILSNLL